MKEQNTTDKAVDNLREVYNIRIKDRKNELNLIMKTFLRYCEGHVQEDGFEVDAMPFLFALYERKESLKGLQKERDALCGVQKV